MNLIFQADWKKAGVFSQVQQFLSDLSFNIVKKDDTRPWGGFFVLDDKQSGHFIQTFFPHDKPEKSFDNQVLSPKILIIEPYKRLSWQYHHRRAELWKVIGGKARVITSDNDEEKVCKDYETGSVIKLQNGERHRLIGLNIWGIVAEIWQHTDINFPSDEEDIIRVQDDFGR